MSEPTLAPPVRLVFRWTPPEDPAIKAIRLLVEEGREDADGNDSNWRALGDFQGDSVTLGGFSPVTAYRFAAAPVFADGTVPPPRLWEPIQVVPLAGGDGPAVPPAVTNLGISQEGSHLNASWDAVDAGYPVEYEVRLSAWAGGILVGRTRDAFLKFPWWFSGAQTYYIRARDPLGRYSASSATFAVTVKALEDYVTDTTTDEHGGGYTGTKTRTVVDTGNLLLALLGEAFSASGDAFDASWIAGRRYSSGTYTTAWIDAGVVQTERLEVQIGAQMRHDTGAAIEAYEATEPVGGPALSGGVARNSGYRSAPSLRDPTGDCHTPADFLIEIDTAQDGVPTPDGFRPFVPGLYTFRQYRFRVTLRGDGFMYARLTSFTLRHRKRNKKAEGSIAVAGSPGPTAISFPSGLFVNAPIVVAAVLDAVGTELVIQAAAVTTSGANLRAYDAAGAEVFTGTIHWIACGT